MRELTQPLEFRKELFVLFIFVLVRLLMGFQL